MQNPVASLARHFFKSLAHAPRAGTKAGRERACLVGEEHAMLPIGPAALDGGER